MENTLKQKLAAGAQPIGQREPYGVPRPHGARLCHHRQRALPHRGRDHRRARACRRAERHLPARACARDQPPRRAQAARRRYSGPDRAERQDARAGTGTRKLREILPHRSAGLLPVTQGRLGL